MIRVHRARALSHRWVVAVGLICGSALVPAGPARARDSADEAKQEFMAGVEAFEGGRHTTALAHFQEAYRLKPHPLVRVNIANCYVKLGKPIEAIFHFKKFLASDEGDPAQRAEIEAEIESLQAKIGSVQLLISPDGAQVRVDEGDTRTSPIMEAIQLSEGRHRVVVSLHGYEAYEGDFQVKGGETVDVNVRLQRSTGGAAAPVPAPEPEEPSSDVDPLEEEADEPEPEAEAEPVADDGWEDSPAGGGTITLPTIIAMAATGAALVTGITLGLFFNDADDNFKQNAAIANDPTQDPLRRQDAWRLGRDALETSQTLAAFADVMFVTAAIGVGVSGYLLLEDLSASGDYGHRRGTQLSASVGPGHAGLQLHHSFE